MSDETADMNRIPEPRQYYSNEDFLNRGMDEIRELRTAITRLQEQLTTAKADAWDEGYDCGAADYTDSPSISSPTGQINPYRATPEDDKT
jgi:hypothetical protein